MAEMLSLLFWNLDCRCEENRPNVRASLERMAATLDVDMFLFAEAGFTGAELADLMRNATQRPHHVQTGSFVTVVSRLPKEAVFFQSESADRRLVIYRLRHENGDLLLAVTHFWDRRNTTLPSLISRAVEFRGVLTRAEDDVGHQRTLFIGDFNLNPFDLPMIDANCLNAVMTRDLAEREERIVDGSVRRFFYNPMWGMFGDRTEGPAGTYFFGSGGSDNHHWHMLDQVLLRPSLMHSLLELKILETDGKHPLITARGRPKVSDHLPLLIRLNLDRLEQAS
jgi:hypothetical protein